MAKDATLGNSVEGARNGFPTEIDQPVADPLENLQEVRTDRDQKFVSMFEASGFDISKRVEIATAAGFAPRNVAKANAGRIIKSLTHNEAMQKALKRKKVDYNRLAEKLVELLDCEHPAFEGKPDNMSQLKAVEMSLRVHDAFPATKLDIDKTERKEIVISAEVVDRLEKFAKLKAIDVSSVTLPRLPD